MERLPHTALPSSESDIEKMGFDKGLRGITENINPFEPDTWQYASWESGRRSGLIYRQAHKLQVVE